MFVHGKVSWRGGDRGMFQGQERVQLNHSRIFGRKLWNEYTKNEFENFYEENKCFDFTPTQPPSINVIVRSLVSFYCHFDSKFQCLFEEIFRGGARTRNVSRSRTRTTKLFTNFWSKLLEKEHKKCV